MYFWGFMRQHAKSILVVLLYTIKQSPPCLVSYSNWFWRLSIYGLDKTSRLWKYASAKHRSGKWEHMESIFVELQKDVNFFSSIPFLIWWVQSSELPCFLPRGRAGINAEWWSDTSDTMFTEVKHVHHSQFRSTCHEITEDCFLASSHKHVSQHSVQNCTWLFLSPHGDLPFAFSLIFPLLWMYDPKICSPASALVYVFISNCSLVSRKSFRPHDLIFFQALSCANSLYSKGPWFFQKIIVIKLKLHPSY